MKKNILIVILIITNILTLVFAYTQHVELQMHQQQANEIRSKAQEVEQLAKEQVERARKQAEIASQEATKAKELAKQAK